MSAIFYAISKRGGHGYLKWVSAVSFDKKGEQLFKGEELHFRVDVSLTETSLRVFGRKPKTEGRPLGMAIKDKPRSLTKIELTLIKQGSPEEMDKIWRRLKGSAENISERQPIMTGTLINCNSLTFELLESEGLYAPRHKYPFATSASRQPNPSYDAD